MSFKHPHPSDLLRMRKPRSKKQYGVHVLDTECRTLEQAVDIIAARATARRVGDALRGRKQTLGQIFGLSRGLANSRVSRKKSARPKLPHPLKDLSDEQKRAKVLEMYDGGEGHWGWGIVAYRRLARAFGVPVGQIIAWVEEP